MLKTNKQTYKQNRLRKVIDQEYYAASQQIEQKMSECPHCPVDLIISRGHQIQWNTIGYIWIAQAPDLSRLISPSFVFK